MFHGMRRKPLGALGGLLIIVLVATALLAPVLAPYDPIKMKSADRLQAPSLNHLLGTDDFGRDILSRVIYGARISMLLGLGAVAISTVLAAIIGVLSGYYGGRIDTILPGMRFAAVAASPVFGGTLASVDDRKAMLYSIMESRSGGHNAGLVEQQG